VVIALCFTRGEPEPQIIRGGPPAEALRGTTVLFRQLASNDEPASFLKVRKIIGKHVHETSDAQRGKREELHTAWKRAHAGLREGLLRTTADLKVANAIHWNQPVGGEDVRPQHVLSLFQYGDLIHWDRHAADFEVLASAGFHRRSHATESLLSWLRRLGSQCDGAPRSTFRGRMMCAKPEPRIRGSVPILLVIGQ